MFALIAALAVTTVQAQTFSFSSYVAGSTSYNTSNSGVTMTVTASGSGFTAGYPAYNAGGIGFLATFVDWANRTTNITYTVTFSKPLIGVHFPLYDVDQNATWDDRIIVTGTSNTGSTVYPTITANSYSAVSGANSNILEGNADNPTFTNAPANVNFSTAISGFTVVYATGASSPADPGSQVIGFGSVGALSTLPIDLTGFTASAVNNNVVLKWEAENQVKFDHFEIERSATGTGAFEKIATVGATAGPVGSYSYADNNIKGKMTTAYYRLKMIDIDGTYTYSFITVVRFGNGTVIDVRPTLLAVDQPVSVSIAAGTNEVYDINLLNLDGRLLAQHKQAAGRVQIATTNLQKGMYVIQVAGKDNKQTYKIMIQ